MAHVNRKLSFVAKNSAANTITYDYLHQPERHTSARRSDSDGIERRLRLLRLLRRRPVGRTLRRRGRSGAGRGWRRRLLDRQADATALAVDLDDPHLHLVARLHDLGG